MSAKPVRILLVDDDEIDREAVERGFAAIGVVCDLVLAVNGTDALRRLRGSEAVAPLNRPYVILLDMNMPRMDGLAFLDELRADPDLRDSIVFVLTTSSRESERTAAYRRGIAGYIPKASAGDDYTDLANLLDRYWSIVELP